MKHLAKSNLDARKITLAYVGPGVVICVVSLFVAMKVGSDFPASGIAEVVTFACSNALLWLLYWTLFQVLPWELYLAFSRKKAIEPAVEAHNQKEKETEVAEHEEENSDEPQERSMPEAPLSSQEQIETQELSQEPIQEQIQEPTQESSDPDSSIARIYEQRREEFRQSQVEKRNALLTAIDTYIGDVMSPFTDDDTVAIIQGEIRQWADNCDHKPNKVSVNRNKLATLDIRHFIWNIGSRLRMTDKRYTTQLLGEFVKLMFPDICSDASDEYLGKNLTLKPNEGIIKIDRPTKGDCAFHWPSSN